MSRCYSCALSPEHASNNVDGGGLISRKFHSLLIKSAHIQSKIECERGRPAPDWIMLLRLKMLRLRLKVRLSALSVAALRPPMPKTSLAAAGT